MTSFNLTGFTLFAIGFGAAYGIGVLVGTTEEGPLMIIGASIIISADLLVRLKGQDGHWLRPSGGGALLFIPLWIVGIIWLVLGVLETVGVLA